MTRESKKFAAIVLAAGQSTRFGPENKLWHPIDNRPGGRPMLEQVLETIHRIGFGQVVVVGAPNDEKIRFVVEQFKFDLVCNPDAKKGMSSSIAVGAARIHPTEFSGIGIFLGDMPFIKPVSISKLISKFYDLNSSCIVRPNINGQLGHPVLFPSKFRGDLQRLTGPNGARPLLHKHSGLLNITQLNDTGMTRDIDTKVDLHFPQ